MLTSTLTKTWVQKHKNTTICNCLNGWNRKGIDYRDGSCLEEVQELGSVQSGAVTRVTPSPTRRSWAASIQMCRRGSASLAHRYCHAVWNKLQAGAFNSQPLTPLMKLGFIGCVRSPPTHPRPIVALSLWSSALSIFDMEKAKALHQSKCHYSSWGRVLCVAMTCVMSH